MGFTKLMVAYILDFIISVTVTVYSKCRLGSQGLGEVDSVLQLTRSQAVITAASRAAFVLEW
jgi:hypothetical protein